MNWVSAFICCVAGLVFADLSADPTYWTKGFRNQKEFEHRPPAFVKIYVQRDQIVMTPLGPFYFNRAGSWEPIRSLSEDMDGLYVIKIQTQCPLCGRCYSGKKIPEDMGCPVWKQEVLPNFWTEP